jgi:K+-transporting ATPase ATPase C chain
VTANNIDRDKELTVKTIRANATFLILTLAVCCVAYPAVLAGIGRVLSPSGTTGSLVEDNGSVRGSRLIAQKFGADEYFQPRPSAADYNGAAASGSNWGANNPKLRDRACQQLGPIIAYKAGSRSAAGGRTPQQDIEAWFAAKPDRAAEWAADSSVAAPNWARTDFADDKYGLQGQFIRQWAKDHPDVIEDWKKANPDKSDDPKPEDLVGPFFASFAKVHPGKFPGVVETKKADGSVDKRIEPVSTDQAIQSNFFDLWLSDPANADKAADLEPVVADMVAASGSGLDPHITLRNALSVYQLDRVAKKRAATPADVDRVKREIADLVRAQSFTPLSGLVGEPLVNVLELNLDLDRKFPVPAQSP